jgi:hypothetical protein
MRRDQAAHGGRRADACLIHGILGKLGGHLGRKGDGPPGPQSLWLGLSWVRDFALAWQTFHGG